jgi:hypothetical protein
MCYLGMSTYPAPVRIYPQGVSATASGIHRAGTTMATGVKDGVVNMQSFSHQRLMQFFGLTFMGAFLMGMAVVIGLPSIALAPAKFAFSFTAGSLCNIAAMGALRGWTAQLQSMLSRDRMLYTVSYVASMLGEGPTTPRPSVNGCLRHVAAEYLARRIATDPCPPNNRPPIVAAAVPAHTVPFMPKRRGIAS